MNTFIGNNDFFYKIVKGYARNMTRDMTVKYKSGVCACCGIQQKGVETAHKRGFDRSVLVKKWIKRSTFQEKNGVCRINVDKFDELFKNFTNDLSNFYFLCRDCHSKYDKGEINEKDFKYVSKSIKTAKNKRKRAPIASNILNKEYFLHGRACSAKEFEAFLRTKPCKVHVTLFYTDKTQNQHVWQAQNFSSTSSLSGNLHGGYLKSWKRNGIIGIKLEIK